MSDAEFTGGCQCGAVTYQSSSPPLAGAHCHCQHCRKTTGAEHLSAVFVPEEAFSYQGQTTIYETTGDRGIPLQRHFCPTCGASLFLEHQPKGAIFIMAGTLDDIEIFKPEFQLFCKHRASWDNISDTVKSYDEMPTDDL